MRQSFRLSVRAFVYVSVAALVCATFVPSQPTSQVAYASIGSAADFVNCTHADTEQLVIRVPPGIDSDSSVWLELLMYNASVVACAARVGCNGVSWAPTAQTYTDLASLNVQARLSNVTLHIQVSLCTGVLLAPIEGAYSGPLYGFAALCTGVTPACSPGATGNTGRDMGMAYYGGPISGAPYTTVCRGATPRIGATGYNWDTSCRCDTRRFPNGTILDANCVPLATQDCAAGCSGHGVCAYDGSCTCTRGWYGSMCGSDCPLMDAAGVECSGHGSCNVPQTMCVCSAPFAGPLCDQCAPGFWGAGCAQVCLGASISTPRGCVCSNDPHRDPLSGCLACAPGYMVGVDGRCYDGGMCDVEKARLLGSVEDPAYWHDPSSYEHMPCALLHMNTVVGIDTPCRENIDAPPCSAHGVCMLPGPVAGYTSSLLPLPYTTRGSTTGAGMLVTATVVPAASLAVYNLSQAALAAPSAAPVFIPLPPLASVVEVVLDDAGYGAVLLRGGGLLGFNASDATVAPWSLASVMAHGNVTDITSGRRISYVFAAGDMGTMGSPRFRYPPALLCVAANTVIRPRSVGRIFSGATSAAGGAHAVALLGTTVGLWLVPDPLGPASATNTTFVALPPTCSAATLLDACIVDAEGSSNASALPSPFHLYALCGDGTTYKATLDMYSTDTITQRDPCYALTRGVVVPVWYPLPFNGTAMKCGAARVYITDTAHRLCDDTMCAEQLNVCATPNSAATVSEIVPLTSALEQSANLVALCSDGTLYTATCAPYVQCAQMALPVPAWMQLRSIARSRGRRVLQADVVDVVTNLDTMSTPMWSSSAAIGTASCICQPGWMGAACNVSSSPCGDAFGGVACTPKLARGSSLPLQPTTYNLRPSIRLAALDNRAPVVRFVQSAEDAQRGSGYTIASAEFGCSALGDTWRLVAARDFDMMPFTLKQKIVLAGVSSTLGADNRFWARRGVGATLPLTYKVLDGGALLTERAHVMSASQRRAQTTEQHTRRARAVAAAAVQSAQEGTLPLLVCAIDGVIDASELALTLPVPPCGGAQEQPPCSVPVWFTAVVCGASNNSAIVCGS